MTRGIWIVAVLAGAKVAVWLLIGAPGVEPLPRSVLLATVLVFSGVAGFLFYGSRRDPRAAPLAAVWAITAASFTAFDQAESPATLLKFLTLSALSPYFTWRFFESFPRVPLFVRGGRWMRLGKRISALAGGLLLGATLMVALLQTAGSPQPFTGWLSIVIVSRGGFHSAIGALLTLPAYGLALYRVRIAPDDERRRVRLLVWGVVLGGSPLLVLSGLFAVVPPLRPLILSPSVFPIAQLVVYSALMSIPVMTAYAVMVQRALDFKLVVRRTLQYMLARYSVLSFVALPFALLIILLYQNRDQTLLQLVAGFRGAGLLGAVAAGLAALRFRRRLLNGLDARFFREQYDARQILEALVEKTRRVRDFESLSRVLGEELDRALHLERVRLLRLDPINLQLVDHVRPLDTDSQIVRRLGQVRRPIVFDLNDPASPAQQLPESEQHWLADAGIELIVPLGTRDQELIGTLALGRKLSGLGFSKEDLSMLATVAISASSALESIAHEQTLWPTDQTLPEDAERLAGECVNCGSLDSSSQTECIRCAGSLQPANLPQTVSSKFRLLRRLGKGGMGIVYEARDLALDRTVAIKTLPRLDPRQAPQLRREARLMASLAHPNLALIFGLETWRGTPLLVIEYLPQGTLADRLARGGLGVGEAIDLAITLSEAVSAVHSAGVLHRDIKPSNVGFNAAGELKLLDFGVARMVQAMGEPDDPASKAAAGTLLYMSPEALAGKEPEPRFDVWAICILLYETITGLNPARCETRQATAARIRRCSFPSISSIFSPCPISLEEFFNDALALDINRRPRNAQDLRNRLLALRNTLPEGIVSAAPSPRHEDDIPTLPGNPGPLR